MKITMRQLRQMITEELGHLIEIETAEEQKQDAITQISNLLVRLEDQGVNAQEILNKAKEAYEKSAPNTSQMERKLTEPEKEKREEIAQAMEEEDPDIDMGKKMAIATSQAKRSA